MNENKIENIFDGSPESLPKHKLTELTPGDEQFEMQKEIAEQYNIDPSKIVLINNEWKVMLSLEEYSDSVTHTKNTGDIN